MLTERRIHVYDVPDSSTEDSQWTKDAFLWEMNWPDIENPVPKDVLEAEYRHVYVAGRWDQLFELRRC